MTQVKELNIYQKLLEVKKKVPYLQKGTKGYNFEYANPETVLGTLNPLLNEQGIILKSEVLEASYERLQIKTKNGIKDENLFITKMRMTWVNVDDPEDKDENLWYSTGINGDEQGYGSALTYGERYFLLKYFSIPTGKDDPDANIKRAKEKDFEEPTNGNAKKEHPETNNLIKAVRDNGVMNTKDSMTDFFNKWSKYYIDNGMTEREVKNIIFEAVQ